MRNTFKLFWCFALLLLGAFCAEKTDWFAPLQERLQLKVIPSAVLSSTGFGEALRQLDLLQVVPNDYTSYRPDHAEALSQRRFLFQRKSRVGIQLYGVDYVPQEELPSSSIIHERELRNPAPLISVVIEPSDLYNPVTGIIVNPKSRGMAWERPAFLSYFEHGKLLFASGIGLRLHGGKSRIARMEKSFRAYFREIYGEDQFKPGLIFDEKSSPLRRLVLHNDRRDDWFLVNPLAYDIARRIGALAPQTKPVRFFLNGIFQGVYVLTEHLSLDYLMSRYGHDQFIFARTRQDGGSSRFQGEDYKSYDEFKAWAKADTPLSLQEAQERVDVENLVFWILSILFCAPTDALQGPALVDLTASPPRWFWINWDMDHSFQDKYHRAEHPWELDSFREISSRDPRGTLFARLMKDDPAFREYFKQKFVHAMNHSLSTDFLDERFAYYQQIAIDYGITERTYLKTLRQFLRQRKAVLRQLMDTRFAYGTSYECRVGTLQKPGQFEIDGYPEESGYAGWYFAGMPVRITFIPDSNHRLSYWRVNGKKVKDRGDHTLELTMDADMTIDAIVVAQ